MDRGRSVIVTSRATGRRDPMDDSSSGPAGAPPVGPRRVERFGGASPDHRRHRGPRRADRRADRLACPRRADRGRPFVADRRLLRPDRHQSSRGHRAASARRPAGRRAARPARPVLPPSSRRSRSRSSASCAVRPPGSAPWSRGGRLRDRVRSHGHAGVVRSTRPEPAACRWPADDLARLGPRGPGDPSSWPCCSRGPWASRSTSPPPSTPPEDGRGGRGRPEAQTLKRNSTTSPSAIT